ncbi:MAG: hypothetical protein R2749_23835 [Acidimicrobiales bacterium]
MDTASAGPLGESITQWLCRAELMTRPFVAVLTDVTVVVVTSAMGTPSWRPDGRPARRRP